MSACARSKAFVHSEAVLDFLKDAVAGAPDLPDDDGKPKRKRCDPRSRLARPRIKGLSPATEY